MIWYGLRPGMGDWMWNCDNGMNIWYDMDCNAMICFIALMICLLALQSIMLIVKLNLAFCSTQPSIEPSWILACCTIYDDPPGNCLRVHSTYSPGLLIWPEEDHASIDDLSDWGRLGRFPPVISLWGRQEDGITTVKLFPLLFTLILNKLCIIISTDPVYLCTRLCMDMYDCDINKTVRIGLMI